MRPEAEPRAHLVVRPLAAKDRGWAESLLVSLWGSSRIVSRGRVHDLMTLPGFVAEDRREPVGLATYQLEDAECELTSLDAVQEHQGAGTALLEAAAILDKYSVEYVYVGELEREVYGDQGLVKFAQLGDVAFQNDYVTIYRIGG